MPTLRDKTSTSKTSENLNYSQDKNSTLYKNNSQFSTSKNKKRKKAVVSLVQEWLELSISFNVLSTVPLYILYNSYCDYIKKNYTIIPLTKKSFSMALKKELEKKIEKKEIYYFTRSRVFLRGIELMKPSI